jgi:DNA recombination protein RmuC
MHNTRPDFNIYLPDRTKVNIDVKFPYSALLKYTESTNKTDKQKYLNDFRRDVKEKIKQVSTRDYVNPEEKTVDFVVLFIPNEMIFSFIYDKMGDVWEEAMQKKVIMAGPFSFTAILRMVKQAYTNFRYQENLHQIIGLIQKFDEEYQRYNESLNKLGERINSVSGQFDVVSITRDKKLSSIVDKIKTQKIKSKNSKLIEPSSQDE